MPTSPRLTLMATSPPWRSSQLRADEELRPDGAARQPGRPALSACVQAVDDIRVLGVDDPPLELERGRQLLALSRPLDRQQPPVLDLLHPGEALVGLVDTVAY